MTWDKDRPDGSITSVNLVDDLIRLNNGFLEDALTSEHYFATGGVQTGRHKFGFGTDTARDAIPDLLLDGTLWHLTGEDEDGNTLPAGYCEPLIRDQTGGQWLRASARYLLAQANEWGDTQSGDYETQSIGSGTLTLDFTEANFFEITLTGPISIANPSAQPAAGLGSTWVVELKQDATGGRTVNSWGAAWIFPFGVEPTLSTAANARDVLVCVLLNDGSIMATLQSSLS